MQAASDSSGHGSVSSLLTASVTRSAMMRDENFDDQKGLEEAIDFVKFQYDLRIDKNDVCTSRDVIEIFAAIGLTFDTLRIHQFINSLADVTADDVIDLFLATKEEQQVDIRMIVFNVRQQTVTMAPWEYFMHKAPCFTPDPDLEYKIVHVSYKLTPRQMLFTSTGVMLLICGLSIVLLMSLLWLDQANSREINKLENFHELLSSFTQSFEQRFISVQGETMIDEADSLAKILQKRFMLNSEKKTHEISATVNHMSESLTEVLHHSIHTVFAEVSGICAGASLLFTPANIASGLFTLDDLLAVVREEWRVDAAFSRWDVAVAQYNSDGSMSMLQESRQLECAHGPCDYTAVAALSHDASSYAAGVNNITRYDSGNDVDVHHNKVVGVRLFLATWNVSVCVTVPMEVVFEHEDFVIRKQLEKWNTLVKETHDRRREIVVVRVPRNVDAERVTYITPRIRQVKPCYAAGTCLGLDSFAKSISLNRRSQTDRFVSYHEEEVIAAGAIVNNGYMTGTDTFVILVTMRMEAVRDNEVDFLIHDVEHLNANSQRSTELSISTVNKTNGKLIAQTNEYRFANDCYGECKRIDPAIVAAQRGFASKSQGWLLQPDYRPEIVITAFAYVDQYDVVIVLERDLLEIRDIGLKALTSIFDINNQNYGGSLEAQLIRLEGTPPMATYDRYADCSHIEECLSTPGHGVVYRSDCKHCTRAIVPPPTQLEFLTKLRFLDECVNVRNCTAEALGYDNGVSRLPFINPSSETQRTDGLDYRKKDVVAVYNYMQNFSIGLMVKLDVEDIQGPIMKNIGVAIGVAFAIVIFGLFSLIVFSRKVLDKIEQEWLSYKAQIDGEKEQFDQMSKTVVPAGLTEGIAAKANALKALALPTVGIVFVDIVGMTERTKSWSPQLVCRYLMYHFNLICRVGDEFGVTRVKMFGDTYFGACGLPEAKAPDAPQDEQDVLVKKLEEERKRVAALRKAKVNIDDGGELVPEIDSLYMSDDAERDDSDSDDGGGFSRLKQGRKGVKQALHAVTFGAVTLQLFSQKYAHFPDRIPVVREPFLEYVNENGASLPGVSGDPADVGYIKMPPIRVGVHVGPVTCCVLETGRTPAFDLFGPEIALAARMQATSMNNRMHVTENVKEALDVQDLHKLFELEPPRKTVVKGRGTISSYFVKSANVAPSPRLLLELGATYANLRVFYEGEDGGERADTDTNEASQRTQNDDQHVSPNQQRQASRGHDLTAHEPPELSPTAAAAEAYREDMRRLSDNNLKQQRRRPKSDRRAAAEEAAAAEEDPDEDYAGENEDD